MKHDSTLDSRPRTVDPRQRFLWGASIAFLGVGLAIAAATAAAPVPEGAPPTAVRAVLSGNLAIAAAGALAHAGLRQGRAHLAGWVLVSTYGAASLVMMAATGGLESPAIANAALVLLVGRWLLGRRPGMGLLGATWIAFVAAFLVVPGTPLALLGLALGGTALAFGLAEEGAWACDQEVEGLRRERERLVALRDTLQASERRLRGARHREAMAHRVQELAGELNGLLLVLAASEEAHDASSDVSYASGDGPDGRASDRVGQRMSELLAWSRRPTAEQPGQLERCLIELRRAFADASGAGVPVEGANPRQQARGRDVALAAQRGVERVDELLGLAGGPEAGHG